MAVQTPHINIQGLPSNDFCLLQMSLQMELLHPAKLSLTIRGKSSPLSLSDASRMMGSTIDLSVQTQRRDAQHELLEDETLTFHGIVFNVRNERSAMGNTPVVTLTAYSPDHLLVDHPHCASFEESSLKQIIDQSISDYSGSLYSSVNPFNTDTLAYTVQYNENTYQFLSRLAMRYGEYMYHDGETFVFGQIPKPQQKKLYPDIDILGYRYSLEMTHDCRTLAAHDYMSDENPTASLSGKDSPYSKNTLHDFSSASPIGVTSNDLKVAAAVESNSFRSRQQLCHLSTQCAGLRMGDKIIIEEYDDDKSLAEHPALTVIAINHSLNADGHYENEITAILCGDDNRPPYPEGDFHPRCSTQRARVVDNNDPEHLGRIRVQFLWQELTTPDRYTPWLRITQPHGGDDKGFYFIPEVGEEVMVAFENGNAEKPYVVGTLYHGQQHPGQQWPDSNNNTKAIRTRNGHTVEIHDEGQGGYIRIYDYQKENYILTYSSDEKLIKLESTGNIELYAQNDIILHAGNDMQIEVGNNRTLEVGSDDTINIGKNQSVRIQEDKNEDVGNDRTDTVGRKYAMSVGEDSDIEIAGDSKTIVANKHTLKADNILQVSEHKTQLYSDTSEQKADSSLKIDGGSDVDIHANNIRIS